MKQSLFAVWLVLALIAIAVAARADCPATPNLSDWSTLISYRPSLLVQQVLVEHNNWYFQHIEDASSDDLNTDYYVALIKAAPTLNGVPMSGYDLLRYLRANFSALMDSTIVQTFEPLDGIQDAAWQSAAPLGAVLRFRLLGPDGITFLDADVVTSDVMDDHWTFSTIHTDIDGYHPVNGNRQFGVTGSDPPYYFYIRGADRPRIAGTGALGFPRADQLWSHVVSEVASFVNNHGGSAELPLDQFYQCSWQNVGVNYWHPSADVPWVVPTVANSSSLHYALKFAPKRQPGLHRHPIAKSTPMPQNGIVPWL